MNRIKEYILENPKKTFFIMLLILILSMFGAFIRLLTYKDEEYKIKPEQQMINNIQSDFDKLNDYYNQYNDLMREKEILDYEYEIN